MLFTPYDAFYGFGKFPSVICVVLIYVVFCWIVCVFLSCGIIP